MFIYINIYREHTTHNVDIMRQLIKSIKRETFPPLLLHLRTWKQDYCGLVCSSNEDLIEIICVNNYRALQNCKICIPTNLLFQHLNGE